MNKFKKAAGLIILLELILIAGLNIFYIINKSNEKGYHKVDVERIIYLLENEPASYNDPKTEADSVQKNDPAAQNDSNAQVNPVQKNPESQSNSNLIDNIKKIDLSQYETVIRITPFDPDEICNNEYMVEEVNGTLLRFEYKEADEKTGLLPMNIGLVVMFLATVILLNFIRIKVIAPFTKMSDMTVELAKGNLLAPIKEEKSRFFGKFLWGMDMLRENLEDSKAKELEYQKEKKTMLLSLSHDIKTPLSAIQLYTKAMSEGLYDTEEKKQEAYAGILNNTKQIKTYCDEIYKLSREDFMELNVNVGEVYLSQVLDKVRAYYSDKLSVLHTDFKISEYDDCLLSADKDRLEEALQNLMENAIKYGDGKEICISFSDEEDCKLITVSNTGCSLEENDISNIFDSFYRGSNTRNIGGNGLGLYIVKQLMKKMDGDVFAEISKDRFNITLVARKA